MSTKGRNKFSGYRDEILKINKDTGESLSNSSLARILISSNELEDKYHQSLRKYVKVVLEGLDHDSEEAPPEVEVETKSDTKSNDYKNKPKFVLSAWNQGTGMMMDIDTYCKHYNLPRKDITSYKLVSHTGTPYYNIVFKENVSEIVQDFDFEGVIKKHIEPAEYVKYEIAKGKDFDTATISDVHVGMETNPDNNSMYAVKWDREEVLIYGEDFVKTTIEEKESPSLVVDELGDFLDGFNAQTTRGGHALPQNMTNEESFDCALELKMLIVDGLVGHYESITFNNICNDNHAGSFGYFVNQAFKNIVNEKYPHIKVVNHRKFINHYFVGNICFLITHGKDDKSLKFGFKPQLDSKGVEKIDQYCKQEGIYKNSDLIIFKKGDSHQALFDMCTSDDFYYFNYPALSPSSQWVQTNFKKGRRGFVNESFKGLKHYLKPKFIV
jgi:hypothetical protein